MQFQCIGHGRPCPYISRLNLCAFALSVVPRERPDGRTPNNRRTTFPFANQQRARLNRVAPFLPPTLSYVNSTPPYGNSTPPYGNSTLPYGNSMPPFASFMLPFDSFMPPYEPPPDVAPLCNAPKPPMRITLISIAATDDSRPIGSIAMKVI